MKTPLSTLLICLGLPSFSYGQEPDQSNSAIHSLSLSQTQYRENFEFENSTQSLNVNGPSFQYSYGQEHYSVGLNYQKADDHKQSLSQVLERQFALMLETEGYGVFAQFYLGQSWLGISVQKSTEFNEYNFSNEDVLIKNKNEIETQSFSVDAGYGWYFENSQFSVSGQLSQQANQQKTLYVESRDILNVRTANPETSNLNEDALLGSVTLDYGFFTDLVFINPDLQLATNVNITRITSLSGNAHIQQNTYYRLPNSNISQSSAESTVENQQDSTRYGVQVSLQGMQNSMTFSLDNEEGQDMADAYFSISLGTQF